MNWDALVLTLQIASASTVLSLLVGVPIAWWLARDNAWYRIVLSAAVMVPMVLPPTVLGYYLLQMFGRRSVLGEILENWLNMSLVFHWTGAALAAFVVSAPFLIRAAQTGFESTDRSYSEAARTLGRSEVAIFFLISIPKTSSCSRGNCNSSFLLLFHPIHCGRTVIDLTDFMNASCIIKDALGSCGLPCINVCHDAEIAPLIKGDCFGHVSLYV